MSKRMHAAVTHIFVLDPQRDTATVVDYRRDGEPRSTVPRLSGRPI